MLTPMSYEVVVLLPQEQFLEVTKRKEGMLEAIEDHVRGTTLERIVQGYKLSR